MLCHSRKRECNSMCARGLFQKYLTSLPYGSIKWEADYRESSRRLILQAASPLPALPTAPGSLRTRSNAVSSAHDRGANSGKLTRCNRLLMAVNTQKCNRLLLLIHFASPHMVLAITRRTRVDNRRCTGQDGHVGRIFLVFARPALIPQKYIYR